MSRAESQAYAKIVGPGWQYYMTKPKIVLGRGGKGVECDVKLSDENAVSRQHFSVRFAPEHEAVEVENLSKNGILVNGVFMAQYGQPVLVRSQSEIAYGRYDTMRVTLLLPVSNNPYAQRKVAGGTHRQVYDRDVNADWIGHVLVSKPDTHLSVEQIVEDLIKNHPHLSGSHPRTAQAIRHIVTQNDQLFRIIPPRSHKNSSDVPKFCVHPSARQRFIHYAKHVHSQLELQPQPHLQPFPRRAHTQPTPNLTLSLSTAGPSMPRTTPIPVTRSNHLP